MYFDLLEYIEVERKKTLIIPTLPAHAVTYHGLTLLRKEANVLGTDA
jgi:hypothetical protein